MAAAAGLQTQTKIIPHEKTTTPQPLKSPKDFEKTTTPQPLKPPKDFGSALAAVDTAKNPQPEKVAKKKRTPSGEKTKTATTPQPTALF